MEAYNKQFVEFIENKLDGRSRMLQFSSNDLFWTRAAGWEKTPNFNILEISMVPNKEQISYFTVGLSEYELRDHENNKQPNRIELMTIYREETDFEELTGDPDDKINFSADTLMYISSYLVNENSYLSKGEVWINWFSKYEKFGELEHLYFMTPIFFENEKLPVTISGNEIELLLCVPISQEELEYFENNGASALEELLYEKNIDVSNLFRKSVI